MPQLKLILVIGQYAQAWHLGPLRKHNLTATVGDWRAILGATEPDRAVLPLPHPSWRNNGWIKKNSWFETELLPDLKRRVAALIPPYEGMKSL